MRALSLLLLSLLLFVQSTVSSSSSSSSQFNLRRHREVSKDGISPKVSSGKRRPNHRRAYELINGRKYFHHHKPRRTQRRGQRRRTAKEDNSKEEVVLDLRRRGKPKVDEPNKNRLFKYNRKPSSNASKKKEFKDHSGGRRHNVPVPQFLMLPWWIPYFVIISVKCFKCGEKRGLNGW